MQYSMVSKAVLRANEVSAKTLSISEAASRSFDTQRSAVSVLTENDAQLQLNKLVLLAIIRTISQE